MVRDELNFPGEEQAPENRGLDFASKNPAISMAYGKDRARLG
jgi:hypothetical protein